MSEPSGEPIRSLLHVPGELRFILRYPAIWPRRLVLVAAIAVGFKPYRLPQSSAEDEAAVMLVFVIGWVLTQLAAESMPGRREMVLVGETLERRGPLGRLQLSVSARPHQLPLIERLPLKCARATKSRRTGWHVLIEVTADSVIGGRYPVPRPQLPLVESTLGEAEIVEDEGYEDVLETVRRRLPAVGLSDPVTWCVAIGALVVTYVLADRHQIRWWRAAQIVGGGATILLALLAVARNDARLRYEGLDHSQQGTLQRTRIGSWVVAAIFGMALLCYGVISPKL